MKLRFLPLAAALLACGSESSSPGGSSSMVNANFQLSTVDGHTVPYAACTYAGDSGSGFTWFNYGNAKLSTAGAFQLKMISAVRVSRPDTNWDFGYAYVTYKPKTVQTDTANMNLSYKFEGGKLVVYDASTGQSWATGTLSGGASALTLTDVTCLPENRKVSLVFNKI